MQALSFSFFDLSISFYFFSLLRSLFLQFPSLDTPKLLNPPLLRKERPGAQPAGLQHVIPLNHTWGVPIPRRAAAAAAAVVATGRAGGRLGLGLDDEEGVASTEDVVVDSHAVQVLLDGKL